MAELDARMLEEQFMLKEHGPANFFGAAAMAVIESLRELKEWILEA